MHRNIIVYLRQCRDTLKSCALVSTGFRDVAHEQLFLFLTLRRSWPEVFGFFSVMPKLSRYVRELAYVGDGLLPIPSERHRFAPYIPVPPNFIFALLEMFPCAKSVHFFRLEITASHWISPSDVLIMHETIETHEESRAPHVLDASPPAVQRLSIRDCYIDPSAENRHTSLIPHLPFLTLLDVEDIDYMKFEPSHFDREYIRFDGNIFLRGSTSLSPHFPCLTNMVIRGVPLVDLVTPLIPPAPIVNLCLDRASSLELVNLCSHLLPACQATLRKLYVGTVEHPRELARSLRFLSHGIFRQTDSFPSLSCVRLSLDLPYYSPVLDSYTSSVQAFLVSFVTSLPATVRHLTFIFQIMDWSPPWEDCPFLAIDFGVVDELLVQRSLPHFEVTCVMYSSSHSEHLATLNVRNLFSRSNPDIHIHTRFSEHRGRESTGFGTYVCCACDD